MKKSFLFLFLMTLPLVAMSQYFNSGNFRCRFDGTKVAILGLSNEAFAAGLTSITIPGYVEYEGTYYKTRVAISAFLYNSTLQNITVNYGCEAIEGNAFKDCSALKWVRLPSSVTFISNDAFQNAGVSTDDYITLYWAINTMPEITYNTFTNTNTKKGIYCFVPTVGIANQLLSNSTYAAQIPMTVASGTVAYDFFKAYSNPSNASSRTYYIVTKRPTTDDYGEAMLVGWNCDTVTVNTEARSYANGQVKPTYVTSVADSVIYAGNKQTVKRFVWSHNNPFGTTRIGRYAFAFASSLKDVVTNASTIDMAAFRNSSVQNVTLQNGVTNVGESAFRNCNGLTNVPLCAGLKTIGDFAYAYEPNVETAILPYGVEHIGEGLFAYDSKLKTVLIPSSVTSIKYTSSEWPMFYNCNAMNELYYNRTDYTTPVSNNNLTGLPTTCKIYVPVGYVEHFKNSSGWSRLASAISAGSFDFVFGSNGVNLFNSSKYHMTVTSSSPVTADGVTYAGTAKYVYHPNNASYTSWQAGDYETDNMYNGGKKYLMTEIGDSCFVGATIGHEIQNMKHLTRIGDYAYYNWAGSHNMTIPASVDYIGQRAFYQANNFNELMIYSPTSGERTLKPYFIGSNKNGFMCYVENSCFASTFDFLNINGSSSSTNKNNFMPFIKPTTTSDVYSFYMRNIDLEASGIDSAYYVEKEVGTKLILKKITEARYLTGMLFFGLTPGRVYKIVNASTLPPKYDKNLLISTAQAAEDIFNESPYRLYTYYYEPETRTFIRPTSSYYSKTGGGYLSAPNAATAGYSELTLSFGGIPGDVNGDGHVSSVDVTALYNYLLNGDDSNLVNGDQDGDGHISSVDITAVYNILLGNVKN